MWQTFFKAVGCYIDVSVERKQKETLPAGARSRVKTITLSQDIKNYFLQLLLVLIQFPVSLFPELHVSVPSAAGSLLFGL